MKNDYITPKMRQFWGPDMQEKLNKQEEEEKVVSIKPNLTIVGGNDGSNLNWLQALPRGAWFLARSKRPNNPLGLQFYQLFSLQIVAKTERSVMLMEKEMEKMLGRVDPVRFCNEWDWHETLWEPEEGKSWPEDYIPIHKEEEQDGNGDRIQGNGEGTAGELAHNDRGPEIHKVPEE